MHSHEQPTQSSATQSATAQSAARPAGQGRRLWPAWAALGVLLFLATQLTVVAFVFQGKWFLLIGPAVVFASKAWSTWNWIRPQIHNDGHPPV